MECYLKRISQISQDIEQKKYEEQRFGSRDYFISKDSSFIFWEKEDRRIILDLKDKENYLRDSNLNSLEDIFNSLLDTKPKQDYMFRFKETTSDEDSDEKKLVQAMSALDKVPCTFETIDELCFADGKDCNSTGMKCVLFGYACLRYTDFELKDKLAGKDIF